MTEILLIYFAIVSVVTFAMYGVDKRRAVKNQWRIPEKTLLGAAFIGGSFGAFAGMRVFHHKTKHGLFKVMIPVFMILHTALLGYLFIQQG